jgi:hypothetical protein
MQGRGQDIAAGLLQRQHAAQSRRISSVVVMTRPLWKVQNGQYISRNDNAQQDNSILIGRIRLALEAVRE